MTTEMKLYTFAASTSSEKIRWVLDAAGLRYHEIRLTPFLHLPQNLKLSGGFTPSVPILEADGETVQDSTEIIEWLETHRAPFALMPADPEQRAAVMHLEARFDHTGPHVVRAMYATLLEQRPELVREIWTQDAGRWTGKALRLGFRPLSYVFRQGMGLSPVATTYSQRLIERAMNEIERAVSKPQRYLVGDRFSVADITAAARLAPLVCPDEHPVFSREDYRDAIAPMVCKWQARPAFDWVRGIYHKHRRVHLIRAATPLVDSGKPRRARSKTS